MTKTLKELRVYQAEIRKKRSDLGLCQRCGKQKNTDKSVCSECKEENTKVRQKSVRRWVREGLCGGCGLEKDSEKLYCAECRERHARYIAKKREFRKANNLCIYCGELGTTYTTRFKTVSCICLDCFFRMASKNVFEGQAKHYLDLKSLWDGRCYICHDFIIFSNAWLDHKIPRAQGGTNELINLAWACKTCNQSKGALTLEEYIEHCRKVLHGNISN